LDHSVHGHFKHKSIGYVNYEVQHTLSYQDLKCTDETDAVT